MQDQAALPLPETADQMFCFAVYRASHAITRAYAPYLQRIGLTYPQYITLTLLWEEDGQSVGMLGDRLGMQTNTVTPLLKRLEDLGHVTRHKGRKDARQVFVHLSESGRALRGQAAEITACMVAATGMEPARLDQLVQELRALSDACDPAGVAAQP